MKAAPFRRESHQPVGTEEMGWLEAHVGRALDGWTGPLAHLMGLSVMKKETSQPDAIGSPMNTLMLWLPVLLAF